MQALETPVNCLKASEQETAINGSGKTHNKPVANTAMAYIFFLKGTFNFHSDGIGKIRIAKSEITLNIPLVRKPAVLLKQRPLT